MMMIALLKLLAGVILIKVPEIIITRQEHPDCSHSISILSCRYTAMVAVVRTGDIVRSVGHVSQSHVKMCGGWK
jgi:hypothetical protein